MIKKLDRSFFNELLYYIVSIILCILFLVVILNLWSANLEIPFSYDGDGLFEGLLVKSVIENGWYTTNAFLGMPGTFVLYDFPVYVNLDFVIIKMIAFFIPNWAYDLNLFYLLTFPLTTVTSLLLLRKLDISPFPSIVGSLLFTFIPFHFLRGVPHLTLSAYYMIPLVVLLLFWLFDDTFLLNYSNTNEKKLTFFIFDYRTVFSILICIGMSSTYTYYPIFSCFFLIIAGIGAALNNKKWMPLINSIILISIILASLLIIISPTLLYQQEHGKNVQVSVRNPQESEIYGLKIIQLLLPIPDHRISFLSEISRAYQSTAPLVNENAFAALGFVGSAGLIITIIVIFLSIFNNSILVKNYNLNLIQKLSAFNLAALLLATIGGFGTVFAYLIFPQIRGYNRISIFIGLFSILTVMLFFDYCIKKYSYSTIKKYFIYSCLVGILIFGVYDQTSNSFSSISNNSGVRNSFINDKNFVNSIESSMENGTMIFQLPYVPFPESPPVYQMTDYDLLKGYLHSHNLRWSYGAMKGREVDDWQRDVVQKPTDELVRTLSFAGFSGIYVDTYGYKDNGNQIIKELTSIFGSEPLMSEDGRLAFFDARPYYNRITANMTREEIVRKQDGALHPLIIS